MGFHNLMVKGVSCYQENPGIYYGYIRFFYLRHRTTRGETDFRGLYLMIFALYFNYYKVYTYVS